MSPTVEEPEVRWYNLKIKGGDVVSIKADVICKPGIDSPFYRLKRDDRLVAEIQKDEVAGWWISSRARSEQKSS